MNPDWDRINAARVRRGAFASSDSDGFNGAFGFRIPGEARLVCVIASDGGGWQHVSVSFGQTSPKTPSWSIMCAVKEIFWGKDEWVMQLHPPSDQNINNHPGCLHLWRPVGTEIPTPPGILVGIKELGTIKA